MDSNSFLNLEASEKFLESITKNVNMGFEKKVVFPGDSLTSNIVKNGGSVNIGVGLNLLKDQVQATNAGILSYRAPSQYWVETSRKRYYPREGDQVVGVIEDRGGDFYTVNIFTGSACILNRLAFEGATKRNKPELKKGDVVYAKVISAVAELDTEITCISSSSSKREWSSGETIYGVLNQGLLINVQTGYARKLLRPDCQVLNSLGKFFVYEVTIGMNGAVWIRSQSHLDHVIIRNAIINAEFLDDIQCEAMVESLIELSKKMNTNK